MRWFALCLLCLAPVALRAQSLPQGLVQGEVLTIDSERLYLDSAFGRAVAAEFDAKGQALAAENRTIEADLTQEERDLTERRATMTPVEFRVLADAFDTKVQGIRREQEAKNRALNQDLEERRVQFLNAAAPVLEELMRQTGASVVLERRTVFLSSNVVDITTLAIERIDLALGDGQGGDD